MKQIINLIKLLLGKGKIEEKIVQIEKLETEVKNEVEVVKEKVKKIKEKVKKPVTKKSEVKKTSAKKK
jgi:hypothetical protein